MKVRPVLFHKTFIKNLQTALPACFYAMPNNSVYIIYARFYEKNFTKTCLEFVFAGFDNFRIDFESGQLFTADSLPISLDEFKNMIQIEEPEIKIFNVSRSLRSYGEAQTTLNKMASKMSDNLNIQ